MDEVSRCAAGDCSAAGEARGCSEVEKAQPMRFAPLWMTLTRVAAVCLLQEYTEEVPRSLAGAGVTALRGEMGRMGQRQLQS